MNLWQTDSITGFPSSKYVVYATVCVYRELYGKSPMVKKKICVNNCLNNPTVTPLSKRMERKSNGL